MADNVDITPGAGATIATDDVGGRHVQLLKPMFGADGTATMVASDSGLPMTSGYKEITGTVAANGTDAFSSDVSAYRSVSIQTTGIWSGTLAFEQSNNGTNWGSVYLQTVESASFSSNSFFNSAQNGTNRIWFGTLTARYLRVRSSSWTSGTATVIAGFWAQSPPMTAQVITPQASLLTTMAPQSLVAADGVNQNSSSGPAVAAPLLGYNGVTWDRYRLPRIFKSVTATASGNTAVWVPTTGKRFQLLRAQFFLTSDAATATGGPLTVKLQDVTTDIGVSVPVYVPTTGGTGGGGWTSGQVDLGAYGYRSSAVNQTLNVNLSAALTAGSLGVMVMGTEE